jgi:hypothetical protein
MRTALAALALLLAAACGEQEEADAPLPWRHCRITGLAGASGLAIFGGDLLAVRGGGSRDVYAIPVGMLRDGGKARARALRLDRDDTAALHGAEAFSAQGYRISHLWPLTVDFQAIAVQPPNFVYLGDRNRRVAYWGRLGLDPRRQTDRLRIEGALVVPGAFREGAEKGDWRDKGPGLSGLTTPGASRKTEDLFAVDEGGPHRAAVVLQKMSRFGMPVGRIARIHPANEDPPVEAISHLPDGSGFLLLHGRRPQSLSRLGDPDASLLPQREPAPALERGWWRGMCHGPDGTLYLVSDGDPAVVAWRGP